MKTNEEKIEHFAENKKTILGELKSHRNRNVMVMLFTYTRDGETFKELNERLNQLNSRYYYMLRLMAAEGTFDNTAQAMRDFEAELKQLVDDIEYELKVATSPDQYYAAVRFQRLRPEETLETLFADYFEEASRVAMDPKSLTDTRCRRRLETLASDIFMHIWTLRRFAPDHVDLLHTILTDANVPLYDRVLWLNAAGLGDPSDRLRNECLAGLARHNEKEIAVAARVWVVINAVRSGKSEVVDGLFADSPQEAAAIMLEYAKALWKPAKEVDYFAEMASMGRFMPMGSDPEKLMAEMPPEIRKKMEDFAKAQVEGADVFARSLGRMRSAPFFGRFSNWFLPFHLEHSDLAQVVESASVGVASIMENMLYLCDSDKYALALNMAAPDARSAEMLAQMYGNFSSIESQIREAGADSGFGDKDAAQVRGNLFKTLTRVVDNKRLGSLDTFPSDVQTLREAVRNLCGGYALKPELEFLPRGLEHAGFHEAAAKFYDDLAAYFDDDTPERAAAFAKAGDCFVKAEMWQEAVDCYTDAITNGDYSYETALELAKVTEYHDTWGSSEFAVADRLAKYAPEHSDDPVYLEVLSRAYCRASQWEKALEAIYNWDYILPEGSDKAKPFMARALIHLGELDQAREVLQSLKPEFKKIRIEIEYALALWLKGRRKEAVDLIESHIVKEKAYTLSYLDSEIDALNMFGNNEFGADEDNSLGLLHDAVSFRIMPPL